jgi:protoheme IX farnesyltransferase
MLVERDLDIAMARTSKRPTLTGVLTLGQIQAFAWILTFTSFGLLWAAANLLTAFMALCGLLTYVFVYTLWLKRVTWQNIVIGGAAGAFPPLVGWAAVSGHLNGFAWFLFALIFTWTPVHFWALAMLIKEDYAAAKVPMLPVVKGDRVTVVQIMVYAVITSVLCVVPFLQREAGWIYMVGSGLLNLALLAQSLRLLKTAEKPEARALFKFSMAYLALIFIVIAADKAVEPAQGGSRPAQAISHVTRLGGLV